MLQSDNELFKSYSPDPHFSDELLNAHGEIAAHWKLFFENYRQLSAEERTERADDMQRLLNENGVTYNIYNDPEGALRPWKLDTIPAIISEIEWQKISAGLEQRALLMQRILQDIYGEQRLIKDKIIPAEIIYRHTGFLRNCTNFIPIHNDFLPLYAVDIVRSLDGNMWVIGDRTQAPSGLGYVLENRQAMTRALPEVFNNLTVRKLGAFYNALSSTLASLAPKGLDNPRIVVLTPGTGNETYFEHAYLASHLGLTLVEGSDLMVKGDYVWLKTMEGLEKVDVILRRIDDIYCDPLELLSESLLGVPGLLHVARQGNISIVNPLGSSIVENPGFVPFLPLAAQYFGMGELQLPSIATWWCGQEKELQYVLAHFDELIIKRIFRSGGKASVFDGGNMSKEEKAALIADICNDPQLYVGQEKVLFASTPMTYNGEIKAGHSVFRSFLVSQGERFTVLPGGLTRTGKEFSDAIISNQLGGLSKDTWVLGTDKLDKGLPLRQYEAPPHNQSEVLPSHTAESLFWVGRYIERLLGNARLQYTIMQYLFQGSRQNVNENEVTEKILLEALTKVTYTLPGFAEGKQAAQLLTSPWKELKEIAFSEKRNGSLSSNLSLFRNAIFSTRGYWNIDIWRVIHQMDAHWNKAQRSSSKERIGIIEDIAALITSLYTILGLNRESVRRDQGWRIMNIGRKIEQTLNAILQLKYIFEWQQTAKVEHELMEVLLRCNQSLQTYRNTYRDYLQMPLVLDLLVLDVANPKALAYMVSMLKENINGLPKSDIIASNADLDRLIFEAEARIRMADKYELSQCNIETGEYENLQIFLDKIYALIYPIANIISKKYFKHTQAQRQLFTSDSLN